MRHILQALHSVKEKENNDLLYKLVTSVIIFHNS